MPFKLLNVIRRIGPVFLILILVGHFNSLAQVFIPFSYWQNPVITISPSGSPQYFQTGDLLTYTLSGGTGSYSVDITAAALADGALLDGASSSPVVDATPDYNARLTAGTSGTMRHKVVTLPRVT